MKENKNMKKKILSHVAGISSMLVGTNFIHVAYNHRNGSSLRFFNLDVEPIVVLDTGLLLVGLGFFIEFCLSFKPLEVK